MDFDLVGSELEGLRSCLNRWPEARREFGLDTSPRGSTPGVGNIHDSSANCDGTYGSMRLYDNVVMKADFNGVSQSHKYQLTRPTRRTFLNHQLPL